MVWTLSTRSCRCSNDRRFLNFFFQAEDGIRDLYVTGVQTCALPILSRTLADRRLYPAVDVAASGTRREELLADAPTVAAKQQLRRGLVGLPPEKAIDVLLAQLRRAKTNAELLAAVS